MLSLIKGNRRRPYRPAPRGRARGPNARGPNGRAGRWDDHNAPDPNSGLTRTGIYILVVLVAVLNKTSSIGSVSDLFSKKRLDAPAPTPTIKVNWGWDLHTFDPDPYLFKLDFPAYIEKRVELHDGDEKEKRVLRRKLRRQKKVSKRALSGFSRSASADAGFSCCRSPRERTCKSLRAPGPGL